MEDNFKHKGRRRILASELREKGIQDDRILNAIENIPRHLFIDPGLSEQAYIDKALPIENDQTISQPYTVAFQTQLLNPSASDKILEIGTGSGYQTAVLDYLNLDIYTIERDHALYRSTSNLFDKMKIKPKKFIYASSSMIYGDFKKKIIEIIKDEEKLKILFHRLHLLYREIL